MHKKLINYKYFFVNTFKYYPFIDKIIKIIR